MMADDLIEIAFELARRDSGRPKSASLRRAASTAYYAHFHALAALGADALIGWRKPWNVFAPVCHSLDHRQARKALNDARQQGLKGSRLSVLAVAFPPFRMRDMTPTIILSLSASIAAVRSN